ncbi:hypothetical protein [Kushneria sinocarnis]|uniref:hypothetical protein n=1 Tax=Kushneria sinocarnis TaxID=595502 RepID=UPI0011C49234|nr:hypothetical protein [Kushneria sinocarnis]
MEIFLTVASIVSGFLSAASWLKASVVKISREEEVSRRKGEAEKKGVKPNLAGVTLDGWDMSGTFRIQAKWNSIAAILAAVTISLQAVVKVLQNI